MMQLIIKNGKVIATHEDHQIVAHLYPDCECFLFEGQLVYPSSLDEPFPDDPRSPTEKEEGYKDRRRVAYPSVQEQLDMLYHDMLNDGTTWLDAITAVKVKHPKPEPK